MYKGVADDVFASMYTSFQTIDALLVAICSMEPARGHDTSLDQSVWIKKSTWLYRMVGSAFEETLMRRVVEGELLPNEALSIVGRKSYLLEPIRPPRK